MTALPMPILAHQAELVKLCRERHVRRLALFGSASKGTGRVDSDLDLLVEFEPGQTPGFGFISLGEELESILGQPVDLNTPGFIHGRFRQQVLDEAVSIYES